MKRIETKYVNLLFLAEEDLCLNMRWATKKELDDELWGRFINQMIRLTGLVDLLGNV